MPRNLPNAEMFLPKDSKITNVVLQNKKRRNLRRNHDSSNSSKSLQVDCLRSHNVVALYYNGIDLTSTLTGDLPLGPVDFCSNDVTDMWNWNAVLLWCLDSQAWLQQPQDFSVLSRPRSLLGNHSERFSRIVCTSVGTERASWSERQTLRKFDEIKVRNGCVLHHMQQRRMEPQNYTTFAWQKYDTLVIVGHNHFDVEIRNAWSMIKAKACDH